VQRALVTALASCAAKRLKLETRRFLDGLSFDELQFIAEFLGAAILETDGAAPLACRVADFRKAKCTCGKGDQDHKMLVLLEYLRRSGLQPASQTMRAGQA
jgi:hypothetical protein